MPYLPKFSINFNKKELRRLPKKQPFICLCNQLLDGVDEQILLEIFQNLGDDFKIITNKKDKGKGHLSTGSKLNVDYFKKLHKTLENAKNVGISTGLLINYSAGKLGNLGKRRSLNQIMKIVKKLELPIVPIRLNSDVHPFFQSGFRARILKKTNHPSIQVKVRIGNTISVAEQQKFVKNSRFRKFVQSKIFALGSDLEVKKFFRLSFAKPAEKLEAVVAPIDAQLIENDIQNLTFENLVVAQSEFDILVAEARQIPNVLLGIGRLRELTFWNVGEGTGKSRDLDEFDLYYYHLIIWDRENKKLVGGYRLGKGDEIFNRLGLEGFYINSLFKIQKGFFPFMRQSIELGRSYIVPEYQRKRLPLFLLWKGIVFFMLKNPTYRYLFGPVSVSKYYSNVSKGLIVAFIRKFYFNNYLAQFLTPRKPFKFKTNKVDIDVLLENMDKEMSNLDSLVKDIEPQHFRIPVLFRQYLKLNARFISFNIDPNFSDCLDGFIILDLNDIPYSMLEALKKEVV